MSDPRDQGVAGPQVLTGQGAARARRLDDLGVRAISAAALAAVALGSVWFGGAIFTVIWAGLCLLIFWEWQRLLGAERLALRCLVGIAALLALVLVSIGHLRPVAAILFLLLPTIPLAVAAPRANRLWGATGILYAGLFLLAVLLLRGSTRDGVYAMFWLFAVVWGTDTFAYFGGRLIGGPKIWPRVSPSKTWAGTLVGLTGGSLFGALIVRGWLGSAYGFVPVFLLSLAVAIVSQAGDASESAMKRHFGVKDTSGLIPGHGGVMDRLDGFIAASIFAVLFGLTRDPSHVAAGLLRWS